MIPKKQIPVPQHPTVEGLVRKAIRMVLPPEWLARAIKGILGQARDSSQGGVPTGGQHQPSLEGLQNILRGNKVFHILTG